MAINPANNARDHPKGNPRMYSRPGKVKLMVVMPATIKILVASLLVMDPPFTPIVRVYNRRVRLSGLDLH